MVHGILHCNMPCPSPVPARSPSNPSVDTFWYRRPAYEQTGIFEEPKVLYLTKTDTTGAPDGLPRGNGSSQGVTVLSQ